MKTARMKIKWLARVPRLLSLLFMAAGLLASATGQVATQGQWTTLPFLMPINPVHMALMHNGQVLIVSGSGNLPSNTNFAAAVWDPQSGNLTTQSLAWDMFCNGMAILPDGRPLIVGGTLQFDPFFGQLATSAYDPATGTFTDQQSMAHGRWYPTVISLSDGSLMTFSGLDENGNTNTTVEIFKAGTGWSSPVTAPWTPPLYPRLHLLPDGKVFYSGSTTSSSIFDPATQTWTLNVAQTNFSGTRTYGTSVLLPLTLASGYKPVVMIMGGSNPATATTELIDLSKATPQWVNGPAMSEARVEMNATILPSGQVVALGGSANDEDGSTASFNTDIYDPPSNTFATGAPNAFPRLYHSNGLLLPDATVLVTGSNPARGTYEQHSEIYSPGYLFNADGSAATRPLDDQRDTGGVYLWQHIPGADTGCRKHHQGGADASRRRNPFIRYGTEAGGTVVHRQQWRAKCDRAAERKRRATRLLYGLYPEFRRRAIGGEFRADHGVHSFHYSHRRGSGSVDGNDLHHEPVRLIYGDCRQLAGSRRLLERIQCHNDLRFVGEHLEQRGGSRQLHYGNRRPDLVRTEHQRRREYCDVDPAMVVVARRICRPL